MVGPLIPPEWVRVAVVEMPPHRHRVGFYAVDPREAWVLRASVAQHYEPLGRTRGHRLKLLAPEDVEAAAGAPPAGAASPAPVAEASGVTRS